MKKVFPLFLLLMFLSSGSAYAVKVASLYTAEFPVSTQADSERAQVVKQGLIQVLVRVSADPNIANNPVVQSVLRRSDYYVQEYSYSLPSETSSLYDLKIRYSKADINRLLRKAQVPYWGDNRPLILVWLALTNKQQNTEIVSNALPGKAMTLLKEQAKIYGLPLIFPMMDVGEMDEISTSTVLNATLPVLQTASKRYSPDALLIGKIAPGKDGFVSEWQLVFDDNHWKWSITNKSPEMLIGDLLNQVSQTLAKNFIAKNANTPQNWLKIEVVNISQPSDLNALIHYLKQLPPVLDVQLSQVSGEDVVLSVLVSGTITTFLKNAAIGQHLVLKSQNEINDRLIYEWVR